jgi:hypothetical protein
LSCCWPDGLLRCCWAAGPLSPCQLLHHATADLPPLDPPALQLPVCWEDRVVQASGSCAPLLPAGASQRQACTACLSGRRLPRRSIHSRSTQPALPVALSHTILPPPPSLCFAPPTGSTPYTATARCPPTSCSPSRWSRWWRACSLVSTPPCSPTARPGLASRTPWVSALPGRCAGWGLQGAPRCSSWRRAGPLPCLAALR